MAVPCTDATADLPLRCYRQPGLLFFHLLVVLLPLLHRLRMPRQGAPPLRPRMPRERHRAKPPTRIGSQISASQAWKLMIVPNLSPASNLHIDTSTTALMHDQN
jgi:hypothetical protein